MTIFLIIFSAFNCCMFLLAALGYSNSNDDDPKHFIFFWSYAVYDSIKDSNLTTAGKWIPIILMSILTAPCILTSALIYGIIIIILFIFIGFKTIYMWIFKKRD